MLDKKFDEEDMAVISEAVEQATLISKEDLKKKVGNINWIMAGVIIVISIAFVQMVINSFNISSASYREYSSRLDNQEQIRIMNETLLEQNVLLNEQLNEMRVQLVEED